MGREFKLTVLGATGFTGKWVVDQIQRTMPELRFAVAGRSMNKLKILSDEANCIQCDIGSCLPVDFFLN